MYCDDRRAVAAAILAKHGYHGGETSAYQRSEKTGIISM